LAEKILSEFGVNFLVAFIFEGTKLLLAKQGKNKFGGVLKKSLTVVSNKLESKYPQEACLLKKKNLQNNLVNCLHSPEIDSALFSKTLQENGFGEAVAKDFFSEIVGEFEKLIEKQVEKDPEIFRSAIFNVTKKLEISASQLLHDLQPIKIELPAIYNLIETNREQLDRIEKKINNLVPELQTFLTKLMAKENLRRASVSNNTNEAQTRPRVLFPIVTVLGHIDTKMKTYFKSLGSEPSKEINFEKTISVITPRTISQGFNILKIKNYIDLYLPGIVIVEPRKRNLRVYDFGILVIDSTRGFDDRIIRHFSWLSSVKLPFIIMARFSDDSWSGWFNVDRDNKDMNNIVQTFSKIGIKSSRFDLITDFTTTVAILPFSTNVDKNSDETPILVLLLAGLISQFQSKRVFC
jgi:hypothetical protein